MKILIDGDGCPVVDLTVSICGEFGLECIILSDTSHVFDKPGAKTILVSKGNDSVDFELVNLVNKGDIVVTQDYGLAAMCLAKQARPISQNGMIFNSDNIDGLLMARHTAREIRMAGGRLKGHGKRTKDQNQAFELNIRALIEGGVEG